MIIKSYDSPDEMKFSRLEQSFLRLFCLFFSHTRFAAYKNWNFEVLNVSKSESGGIKVNLILIYLETPPK